MLSHSSCNINNEFAFDYQNSNGFIFVYLVMNTSEFDSFDSRFNLKHSEKFNYHIIGTQKLLLQLEINFQSNYFTTMKNASLLSILTILNINSLKLSISTAMYVFTSINHTKFRSFFSGKIDLKSFFYHET